MMFQVFLTKRICENLAKQEQRWTLSTNMGTIFRIMIVFVSFSKDVFEGLLFCGAEIVVN